MSVQMLQALEMIANKITGSDAVLNAPDRFAFDKKVTSDNLKPQQQIQHKYDSNANRVHPYSKPSRDCGYHAESLFVSDKELEIQLQQKLSEESEKTEPDHDTIKMFVGQLPKSMDENDLRKMFEEYGRVYQVNLLRDPATGISRGCCFVTYFTRKASLRAQDVLHNIKTLNGMHNPIQMRPAASENRCERKLFVGMLSKKYVENDVRALFSPYGLIEECTVLRNPSGQSRGCAFVTFSSKQSALNAIKGLHHSQTMEGCSSPLVVKFADTQKDKDQKRIHQIQSTLWNGAIAATTPVQPLLAQNPAMAAAAAAAVAASQQPQFMPSPLFNPPTPNDSMQFLQSAVNSIGGGGGSAGLQLLATDGLLSAPINMQNLMTLAAFNHPAAAAVTPSALFLQNSAKSNSLPTATSLTPVTNSLADVNTGIYGPIITNSTSPLSSATVLPSINALAVANAAGKQIEGPEGCNLFIYHIPQEFTDTDLASTFLPFGNVLSAKVFIDKVTKLSKCFGFVSFDNASSAQAAIQAMDHFQIGTKHLKVQLKRQRDPNSSSSSLPNPMSSSSILPSPPSYNITNNIATTTTSRNLSGIISSAL